MAAQATFLSNQLACVAKLKSQLSAKAVGYGPATYLVYFGVQVDQQHEGYDAMYNESAPVEVHCVQWRGSQLGCFQGWHQNRVIVNWVNLFSVLDSGLKKPRHGEDDGQKGHS